MTLRYWFPILAGILIGTSYIPFPPWAIFFAWIPLWISWRESSTYWQAFLAGWLTQFVLTFIGFHWVAHTMMEFGHLKAPLAVAGLLGFCAFANLHVALAGLVGVYIRRKLNLGFTTTALLFAWLVALGEMVYPMIFPWHQGYAWLWAKWPGIQWTDIIGFHGLSVVTLTCNALLWVAWQKGHTPKVKWLGSTSVLLFLLAFNWSGKFHGEFWQTTDVAKNFTVVQANIGNLQKQMAAKGRGYRNSIIGQYITQTQQVLTDHPDTHFVVWPETAFPDELDIQFQHEPHQQKLFNFVRDRKIHLITGGYSKDTSLDKIYNAIFLVSPFGDTPHPPYRKTYLLAFGEYFPGAKYFPFLKDLVPAISDFGRGSGPTVYEFQQTQLGLQVCYEGLYPEFSRALVKQGAEVFINLTNDSWFGKLFEPYQHLYMTLARAIENRRPLVRSTNTGYSTAILASGEVLTLSTLHQEWQGQFRIPYKSNAPLTIYSRYGQWLPWLLSFAILVLLIASSLLKEDYDKKSHRQ